MAPGRSQTVRGPLLRRVAAIDGEALPGEGRHPVAGEEQDGFGDLFRGGGTFGRDRGKKCCLGFLAADEALEHLCGHRTRRHGIDPHAGSRTFERSGLGESFNGMLAGHVDRRPGMPTWPAIDERLMIEPDPWVSMTRISCLIDSSVPSTLVAKVAS